MPKLSNWRNAKGNNYKFIDHHIKQQFDIGGTQVFLHKYIGPIESGDTGTATRERGDLSQPNYMGNDSGMPWEHGITGSTENDIQDLFYLENRDRKYEPNVYEMRGTYMVNDNDFDLKQFGFFLSSDNVMISFHYNDMVAKLGRKIMSGDVLELTHLRDTDLLDGGPAVNKYFVVEDAQKSAEGYDAHWHSHIWRCRLSPMKNQQEFLDILERPATDVNGDPINKTLEEIISTLPADIMISEAIDNEANRQIPFRNYEHAHLYIRPTVDPETGEYIPFSSNKYPILLNYGDGAPPNGATLVGSGKNWPETSADGDFFLRTDYQPNVLFRRAGNVWVREEIDYRSKWSAAHDALRSLINRTDTMRNPTTGERMEQRVSLSKVIKPKNDF